MEITFKMPAAEDEFFREGCFDSNLGKEIRIQGMVGLLTKAEVVEDGKAVHFTFDIEAVTPMQLLSIKDLNNGIIWSIGDR